MQKVWTNPSYERSFIQANVIQNQLIQYLNLRLEYEDGTQKNISIFKNMEYKFKFYDPNLGRLQSMTALVIDVFEDTIAIKYISPNKTSIENCKQCRDRFKCDKYSSNKECAPMPTCNCILNPPDISMYDDPKIYYIPIQNLVAVDYVITPNNNKPDNKGVRVMLLGISATMVKAIIVRMEFFDDNFDEAVKLVDLKADGIYDISYEDKDGSVYESRVKVVKIEQLDKPKPSRPGKGYVREAVGMNDEVIEYHHHDKRDFMKQPPVPMVNIIVDTSETFDGNLESIMLHTIRDCTCISEPPEQDIPDVENCCDYCGYRTGNCNPCNCGHYVLQKPVPPEKPNKPKPIVYKYEQAKVIINGDKVEVFSEGNKNELLLEDLVKFYIGIE